MRKTSPFIFAIAALVLAAPASAVPGADKPPRPEKPAKPDKPAKGIAYVFKGTYAGEGSVAVTATNKHARSFDDQTVAFDFTSAKVSVADTNVDGVADLLDVVTGDSVVVKAKLPKGGIPAQPIAAKQLVDQTNPELEPLS